MDGGERRWLAGQLEEVKFFSGGGKKKKRGEPVGTRSPPGNRSIAFMSLSLAEKERRVSDPVLNKKRRGRESRAAVTMLKKKRHWSSAAATRRLLGTSVAGRERKKRTRTRSIRRHENMPGRRAHVSLTLQKGRGKKRRRIWRQPQYDKKKERGKNSSTFSIRTAFDKGAGKEKFCPSSAEGGKKKRQRDNLRSTREKWNLIYGEGSYPPPRRKKKEEGMENFTE